MSFANLAGYTGLQRCCLLEEWNKCLGGRPEDLEILSHCLELSRKFTTCGMSPANARVMCVCVCVCVCEGGGTCG